MGPPRELAGPSASRWAGLQDERPSPEARDGCRRRAGPWSASNPRSLLRPVRRSKSSKVSRAIRMATWCGQVYRIKYATKKTTSTPGSDPPRFVRKRTRPAFHDSTGLRPRRLAPLHAWSRAFFGCLAARSLVLEPTSSRRNPGGPLRIRVRVRVPVRGGVRVPARGRDCIPWPGGAHSGDWRRSWGVHTVSDPFAGRARPVSPDRSNVGRMPR